jgi:hypothetical protein
VKQQLSAIQERAKAAIELKNEEAEVKLNALRAQAETAAQDAKVKIKKRIADAQADFETRSKKLNQAWDLDGQAGACAATPPIM